MSAPDLKGFIQVGFDVLSSRVDEVTRKMLLQVGDVVTSTIDHGRAENWQHYGFASRMPKPEPGKRAAQVILLRTGDYDIALASQDLRGLELYGELGYGEVAIYSAGEDGKGQARGLWKNDGSISLYTKKGNTKDGVGMMVQLDAQDGAIRAINPDGHGIIIDADGVVITSKKASLRLGSDGAVKLIATKQAQVDGTSVLIGSKGVVGANSAIAGPTGLAGVASTKVIIDPGA